MGRISLVEIERRRRVQSIQKTLELVTRELNDPTVPKERIPNLGKLQVALLNALRKLENAAPADAAPRRRGRPPSPYPFKVIAANGGLVALFKRGTHILHIPVPDSADMNPAHAPREWVARATAAGLEEELKKINAPLDVVSSPATTTEESTATAAQPRTTECCELGCDKYLSCGCKCRAVERVGHFCGKEPLRTQTAPNSLLG